MFQVKKKNKDLESFGKNRKRNTIITISILGISLIIGVIALFKTYAFFEEKHNVKEQVSSHWNLLSVKVEGKETESIPERGLYKINVECTNGYGEWDYNSWSLKLTDLKENTKCDIEFTKNLTTEEYNKYIEAGIALRRNTYREKNITEYYSDGSLYEMISNGTFDDIYVGDYINANGVTWLIADIDNYLHSGNEELTKHHVTVIPATPLLNAPMNETGTTEGGYANSKMASETLPNLVSEEGVIGKAFGNHIIEYQNLLTTHVKTEAINQSGGRFGGASDEWEWYTRKIDLMSEVNVYGTTVWSSSSYDTGIDNRQYAIFQLKPEYINSYDNERFHSWLKDISGTPRFARVDICGHSYGHYGAASVSYGVRPRFLIG